MFNIALLWPQIPPNTGNIIRLCANIGCHLHLILPMGFSLQDKQLRRAGLDYHDLTHITQHQNFDAFMRYVQQHQRRPLLCTSKAGQRYDHVTFQASDTLLFGPETIEIPQTIMSMIPEKDRLRIPMQAGARCLNLANAVSVIAYEAWRQMDFIQGK
ncbi:MAG: tRNA (cytidine(34)-2'-O)-methyltransferase [Gammaproteobacteria bacterium]|nr:MAG: tRNA (cytidine(34)-2'-O)-methyltransferase [Gammaproteobacteria bacterium]